MKFESAFQRGITWTQVVGHARAPGRSEVHADVQPIRVIRVLDGAYRVGDRVDQSLRRWSFGSQIFELVGLSREYHETGGHWDGPGSG